MEPTIPQEPQAQQEVPAHVQRMMSEAYQLNGNLTKLNAFVEKVAQSNELPDGMTGDDFDLLTEQGDHMREYLNTLMSRLKRAGIDADQVQALGDDAMAMAEAVNNVFEKAADEHDAELSLWPVWQHLKDSLGKTQDKGLRVRMESLAAELQHHNI